MQIFESIFYRDKARKTHNLSAIEHTFFMDGKGCKFLSENFAEEAFECGNCGNHVCKEQAEIWSRVCPHCFGRLYRIS